MKTEDLIAGLAAQPTRVLSSQKIWLAMTASAGLVMASAIVGLGFGIRSDASVAGLAISLKSTFGLIAAIALAPLVLNLAQPNTVLGRLKLPIVGFVAVSIAAAIAAIWNEGSLAGLALHAGVPECIKRVPLLALPMSTVMFLVARRLAPTRLTLAGAAIGAFSGAVSIIAYSWFCTGDSVAYVAVWYLTSIVICGLLGAAVGARVLRW